MGVSEGLLYTKEHEWVKIEGNQATFGISSHAQDALGDITFVELPKVGDEVKKSYAFSTVESVKAASDIHAPLSGKVIKINEKLTTSAEIINQSPYGEGWFIVIKIKDKKEKESLMSASDYKEYLKGLDK